VVSRRIDDSILPKKESPESPNKIDGIDALLEALIPMLKAPQKPAFQAFVISGAR
jgi:phage terminase large subunit-like protein